MQLESFQIWLVAFFPIELSFLRKKIGLFLEPLFNMWRVKEKFSHNHGHFGKVWIYQT